MANSSNEKKRIILTGSAGFIGSNLVRKIFYDKYPCELFSVDKIAHSSMLHNVYQHKLHEFFIADICDEHIMNKIFEYTKPDYVIHMAAESSVDKSVHDPYVFTKSNVLGTQVMINLALKYKVEKFIQISTDEVYGHLESKNEAPWKEDAPVKARNTYSSTKAAAEMLVQAAGNTHGLPYIITRSCNNFGHRQLTTNLIPRAIQCILNGKPVPVYGSGSQMREYIHVFDNCSALMKIMDKGEAGQIYNISTGFEKTTLEVVQSIIKIMGKGSFEFVEDRPGHDFRYAIDSSKVRNLGWQPVYKFDDGLNNCIEWYIDNKWFLKSLTV